MVVLLFTAPRVNRPICFTIIIQLFSAMRKTRGNSSHSFSNYNKNNNILDQYIYGYRSAEKKQGSFRAGCLNCSSDGCNVVVVAVESIVKKISPSSCRCVFVVVVCARSRASKQASTQREGERERLSLFFATIMQASKQVVVAVLLFVCCCCVGCCLFSVFSLLSEQRLAHGLVCSLFGAPSRSC